MNDCKKLILERYLGEYIQAGEHDAQYRKSSEDIALELSGMGTFSIDAITEMMICYNYSVGFGDDGKPYWLMKSAVSRLTV